MGTADSRTVVVLLRCLGRRRRPGMRQPQGCKPSFLQQPEQPHRLACLGFTVRHGARLGRLLVLAEMASRRKSAITSSPQRGAELQAYINTPTRASFFDGAQGRAHFEAGGQFSRARAPNFRPGRIHTLALATAAALAEMAHRAGLQNGPFLRSWSRTCCGALSSLRLSNSQGGCSRKLLAPVSSSQQQQQ